MILPWAGRWLFFLTAGPLNICWDHGEHIRLKKLRPKQELLLLTMVSRTGPAGLALFLLCCVGSLLSYPVPPRDNCVQGRRIKELQLSSKELLQNYKDEERVLKSTPYPLPSFNLSCQPPNIINSSNILPYFRAIQPFLNNENVNETIGHLDRLKGGPETEVSVPTDAFLRKRFILAVLREFSTCMESMSPMKICEDFKKIKMSDS